MWSTSCTANYQDKQTDVCRANSQIFSILGCQVLVPCLSLLIHHSIKMNYFPVRDFPEIGTFHLFVFVINRPGGCGRVMSDEKKCLHLKCPPLWHDVGPATLPWNLKCPHSHSNNSGLNCITEHLRYQILMGTGNFEKKGRDSPPEMRECLSSY